MYFGGRAVRYTLSVMCAVRVWFEMHCPELCFVLKCVTFEHPVYILFFLWYCAKSSEAFRLILMPLKTQRLLSLAYVAHALT